jgi:prophage regulatory protein
MVNKVLRLPDVLAQVNLSRSQVYLMIGRGEFPAPIKLSARASGWLEAAVDAWIESRRPASRKEGLA